MKKTKKTLLISSVILLGWIPTATFAATNAYSANAAVVGSNSQRNNNNRQNNNSKNNNNNQSNKNQKNNVNQNVNNNQPVNNNNNVNNNYNNNTTQTAGLTNIQNLSGYHSVTLAGPSGFVYSLYLTSGAKGSRGLAGETSWYTDKTAQDSAGNTYYRVSTDEWVKADTGVTFN